MLDQNIVREATRLTRAGQLVEATALLQRVLRGESVAGSSGSTASDAPARLESPTIDLKANVVEEEEGRQTTQTSAAAGRRRKHAALLDGMTRIVANSLGRPRRTNQVTGGVSAKVIKKAIASGINISRP